LQAFEDDAGWLLGGQTGEADGIAGVPRTKWVKRVADELQMNCKRAALLMDCSAYGPRETWVAGLFARRTRRPGDFSSYLTPGLTGFGGPRSDYG
jgi:hypothetical protein